MTVIKGVALAFLSEQAKEAFEYPHTYDCLIPNLPFSPLII